MKSTTATVTIGKLWQIFATYDIPEVLVSDNGTAFTAEEFQKFVTSNGIRHVQ